MNTQRDHPICPERRTADNSALGARQRSSSQSEDDADCGDEEEHFSECLDDARALLEDNGGAADMPDGSQTSKLESRPTPSAHDVPHQAGSSSAYSSFRSENDTHGRNHPAQATNFTKIPPSVTQFDELILHKAVFNNDTTVILNLLGNTNFLRQHGLYNKKDKHGNTALHLACMLGRSEQIIKAFLTNNNETTTGAIDRATTWAIDVKNLQRWTPFHEACSYGNRAVIKLMVKQLGDQVDDALKNLHLPESLEKTRNYRLVLRWEFLTWFPFVSQMLPSEACVINKQGSCIRIDTRLLDFEGLFRKKGDSCIVFSDKKWILMNNRTKKYDVFGNPNAYKDIEQHVDEFMSTDIVDLELKSSEMALSRSISGWVFKSDRTSLVGKYNAAVYDYTNVFLIWRKRREHLSEEDLKRNKSIYKNFVDLLKLNNPAVENETTETLGHSDQGANGNTKDVPLAHRPSLPPPPPTNVTWEQYIQAEPGDYPALGREPKLKIMKKPLKASVAMSKDCPITKSEFIDLLSIVPLKLFKKLKEFIELKLPDGFPVRVDIPIFALLMARISFEDFTFIDDPIDMSLFKVPDDYVRDKDLLPGKFRRGGPDGEHWD